MNYRIFFLRDEPGILFAPYSINGRQTEKGEIIVDHRKGGVGIFNDGIELEISPDEIRRILRWFRLVQCQVSLDEYDLIIAERLEAAYYILINLRFGS